MAESLFTMFYFQALRDSTRRFAFGNRQNPRELSLTSIKVAETNSYDIPSDKSLVTVWTYPVAETRQLRLLAINPAEGNATLWAKLTYTNAAAGNSVVHRVKIDQHTPLLINSEGGAVNDDLATANQTQLRQVDLINDGGSVLGVEVGVVYE